MVGAWVYEEPKALDVLFAALNDSDLFVRVSAFMASEGGMTRVKEDDTAGRARYVNAWIAGTKAKEPEVRSVAGHILAVYGFGDQSTKPGVQPAVMALLTDSMPGPRAAAIAFAGDQNLREHKAAVLKALDDSGKAMVTLSGFKDLAGTPNMLNASLYPLEDPYEVRHYAAQAVQKWANNDGETLDWAPMPDDGDEEATKKAMEARIAAARKWLAKLK